MIRVHGRSTFPSCSLKVLNNKEQDGSGFWCAPYGKHQNLAIYLFLKAQILILSPKNMWIAKSDHILGGKRHVFKSRRSHLHFFNIKYKSHNIFYFKSLQIRKTSPLSLLFTFKTLKHSNLKHWICVIIG